MAQEERRRSSLAALKARSPPPPSALIVSLLQSIERGHVSDKHALGANQPTKVCRYFESQKISGGEYADSEPKDFRACLLLTGNSCKTLWLPMEATKRLTQRLKDLPVLQLTDCANSQRVAEEQFDAAHSWRQQGSATPSWLHKSIIGAVPLHAHEQSLQQLWTSSPLCSRRDLASTDKLATASKNDDEHHEEAPSPAARVAAAQTPPQEH